MLLAKSDGVPQTPSERNAARERAGLPSGFRHEMLSVQLAERVGLPEDVAAERDLILHLIAAHHGYGRPFAPVVLDDDPPDVEFAGVALTAADRAGSHPHRLDSGVADRFWSLTRRFGWWGLAYLEALLRLADQQASAARGRRKIRQRRTPPEPTEETHEHRYVDSEIAPRGRPRACSFPASTAPTRWGSSRRWACFRVLDDSSSEASRMSWRPFGWDVGSPSFTRRRGSTLDEDDAPRRVVWSDSRAHQGPSGGAPQPASTAACGRPASAAARSSGTSPTAPTGRGWTGASAIASDFAAPDRSTSCRRHAATISMVTWSR